MRPNLKQTRTKQLLKPFRLKFHRLFARYYQYSRSVTSSKNIASCDATRYKAIAEAIPATAAKINMFFIISIFYYPKAGIYRFGNNKANGTDNL